MIHGDSRGASVHAPDMEESTLPTDADHVVGGGRAIPRDLTPEAAAHLTAAGGDPCISVLMPTTPAARMAIADRERLAGLLLDAERRLDDQPLGDRERLMCELRRQARIAQDSMTQNALGLFVSHSVSRAWALPVAVHQKVVVESTFATRDLLRALHRTPPHLVLRVDDFGARVYWVAAHVTLLDTVERLPVGTARLVASPNLHRSDPRSGLGRAAERGAGDRTDLLARIDTCMARLCEERPAPLVLAGDAALVNELKNSARWLHRLAGAVVGPTAHNPDQLFSASALCLEDYLHRRGQQTLESLREAAVNDPEQVVAGLDQCWMAVADRTPGTLVVEQSYVHPRLPGEGGGPVSHDLIDDLLEHAIQAGNLIAFVDDAQLHEFGGIALLRSR
ncbi:hypothetical protein ASG88_21845 [Nocardioides sp. Soil777]|uniref:baeRF3 domain-containing protein n=1 Tax=Nocardioides sp. Soil777 TaxID=1736409 RepID=UPI0007029AFC|nr:hypothetical protein [Nocardioides sp. Soil777]KRF04086.1 hypothetical protein ASG88_21845 [Nocardioides sp. Soil777]